MTNLLSVKDLIVTPFEWVQAQQFRRNGEDYLRDAKRLGVSSTGMFLLAYEAVHTICVGYIYAHGLAPTNGPGHRAKILHLALQELGLPTEEVYEVLAAHARRNETTYRAPAPPVSAATAKEMLSVAQNVLLKAKSTHPDWFDDTGASATKT
jgi:hypothetical protein